ncbi:MAG: cytochrome c3 family protein [Nitrospirota bacterium]
MKKYWNGIEGLFRNFKLSFLCSQLGSNSFKLLALSSVLSVLLIIGWLLYPDKASSGPYLDSAHGNTTYGVKRNATGFPSDYTRGLCAHCHEQHASIGGAEPQPLDNHPSKYLLLSDFVGQFNVPCFDCHTETNQLQDPQGPMNQQYNYSNIAGGDTNNCPDNINRSFAFITSDCTLSRNNCSSSVGSSHCLNKIAIFLKNIWGFNSVAANNDPCSGCHNPHRAQRDPHTITGRIVDGKLVSVVSRPTQHIDLMTWELWGDDSTERMSNKAASLGGTYCAPYRYNSTTTREPDGCSAPPTDCSTGCSNGSNLADYVSLCTDCHNSTNIINSTRLGRNLYRINWSAGGDFHAGRQRIDNGGDFSRTGEYGDLLEPYKSGGMPNYVLSCTDCHEPHGSPNEFLLRQSLNGTSVGTISSNGLWFNWCQACHFVDPIPPPSHLPPVDATTNCFQGGACHHHCDPCSSNNLF